MYFPNLHRLKSIFTLKWIHNKGFTEENLEDADFLIDQLECYIKGTTNPLVQITQLFSLKHDPAQSIESFVTEIKERCRLCEFVTSKKLTFLLEHSALMASMVTWLSNPKS